MVNGKWLPDFMERFKASAWHQLYLPLLPFTHARSESINADSLNSNFLQLGRRSGGRPQPQFTPGGLPVNSETHYVSENQTHELPIVSPTRYQLCHRDHDILILLKISYPTLTSHITIQGAETSHTGPCSSDKIFLCRL